MSGDDGDLFGFGRAVLDRLDRIIELLEQPQVNEKDDSDDELQREQDNSKKRRGVSPAAYRTNGIKVLTSLLSAPNPNVGKLAVSLERENNINHSMVTAILNIMQSEGIINISGGSGQARSIRLTNITNAEKKVAELKEEIRVEAQKLFSEAE